LGETGVFPKILFLFYGAFCLPSPAPKTLRKFSPSPKSYLALQYILINQIVNGNMNKFISLGLMEESNFVSSGTQFATDDPYVPILLNEDNLCTGCRYRRFAMKLEVPLILKRRR
jgi:hypothetical protein